MFTTKAKSDLALAELKIDHLKESIREKDLTIQELRADVKYLNKRIDDLIEKLETRVVAGPVPFLDHFGELKQPDTLKEKALALAEEEKIDQETFYKAWQQIHGDPDSALSTVVEQMKEIS